jgi:YVTN family beta-propeller protein
MKIFLRCCAVALAASNLSADEPTSLKQSQVISLPAVAGRIDHLSLDAANRRLFVAALGNNTIEVVDLAADKVAHTIRGLDEPQGVCFVPELNRLYVANGGDGTLRVFDGGTFESIATLKFSGDADNVRYDPRAKLLFVGYGSGALGIVDVVKNEIAGDIPLGAHPESFQLDPNGEKIFVNFRGRNINALLSGL